MKADRLRGQAFVPARLLTYLPTDLAEVELPGAVLLADLAQFTQFTEALSAKAGRDGGEWVGRGLNEVLAPLIECVIAHGGDVAKFSGDGLLCVFPGYAGVGSGPLAAGSEIAAAVVAGPDGWEHGFRVAVARGLIRLRRIGGVGGRYELVASGPAVDAVHREVPKVLPGHTRELPYEWPADPGAAVPRSGEPADPNAFLPPFVQARLGLMGEWLQELRTLTVMFVSIGLAHDEADAQPMGWAIQSVLHAEGGQLLRLGIEAGQLIGEAAFGLPLGAAAAGPPQALKAALSMLAACPAASVGVATGRVLLGPIGGPVRRQLTTLGSPVNLAARLMQSASSGEALVDEASWQAGWRACAGQERVLELKGLGVRRCWRIETLRVDAGDSNTAIGRDEELSALESHVCGEGSARLALVRGQAGAGKSTLARALIDRLSRRGVAVWSLTGAPVGRDTPYAGMRPLIAKLCGVGQSPFALERLESVATSLLGAADRAPLLADALGLSVVETAYTRQLIGPVRADHIRQSVQSLIESAAGADPPVLLIDDAHWLDPATWRLLQRIVVDGGALRIVLLMRPFPSGEPSELQHMIQHGALRLELGPLGTTDILAVVSQRTAAHTINLELGTWLVARAQGNPFFASELAATLVDKGCARLVHGELDFVGGAADTESLPMAQSVESTLEQRIDCLHVADSAILKVASVAGTRFGLDLLAHLATDSDEAELAESTRRLVGADLLVRVDGAQFDFRHRLIQEAAYRMLLLTHRRRLHAVVARWLEERSGGQLDERASELAHHWQGAGEDVRALPWIERAGRQALRTGADREAATHFRNLLSLAREANLGDQAAWRRQLALAQFGLGDVDGVALEARRAIELVALPLPSTPAGWAGFALRRVLQRSLGLPVRPRLTDAASAAEAARAAGLLAEASYFLNRPETMVASALLAVDLAARAGPSVPVSVAHGMLGVVAGMARLNGIGQRHLLLARSIADAAGDTLQQGVARFYAGLYHACGGNWDASNEAANQALDFTERLGASTQSGFQFTLLATNGLYVGRYAASRQWMSVVRQRALRQSNVQQQGWAFNVVSVADLHQGRWDDAIAGAQNGKNIFNRERDLVSLIISEGVLCAALMGAGMRADAARHAADVGRLLRGARPTTWGQLEGFAGACEVYAELGRTHPHLASRLDEVIGLCLGRLRQFAWIFPFGRARWHYVQGLLALKKRRGVSAVRHFDAAVAMAQKFAMPYEELRARRLLAECAPVPQRAGHVARLPDLERAIAGAH